MKTILMFLFLLPALAQALEVDEKLTARILRMSESKKTIMVNRGTEDGLVEGDHARFIVTAGIVARAACVKVSPTRSVWSIYRLVNADFLVDDSVMTLKIVPPTKITKDESKALVQEDIPTKVAQGDAPLGIPLAEGAQDIDKNAADQPDGMTAKDLEDLEASKTIIERNIEVFSFLNISGLSSLTKSDTGNKQFKSSQDTHTIAVGAEWYSQREREWYSRFSLVGSFNLMRQNSQAYNGATASNDVNEFSIGTNWHPSTLPSTIMDFIPFLHASMNFGTARSTYSSGSETLNSTSLSGNGKTSGFALGFGFKFYTLKGFGARILADYYYRVEKFSADENKDAFNRTVAGPRLMLGLSYRF